MPFSSGADLENVMNEGALLAVRRRKNIISQQELVDAVARVQMGPEKRSHKVTEKDRKLTAFHEAGHAVLGYLLPDCEDVHLVTIVPRGQAGGYTLSLPSEENDGYRRNELIARITMMLGGHAAERTALEDISTGASSDIKRATELARGMVTKWGMSDALGTIYLGSDEEVFVGMEFGHGREYSEQFAAAIDTEVKNLIDRCYKQALELLAQHRDQLDAVAEALLDRDTLNRAEFEAVMKGEALPPKTEAESVKPAQEPASAAAPFAPAQPEEESGEAFTEPDTFRKQLNDSWAEFERSLKQHGVSAPRQPEGEEEPAAREDTPDDQTDKDE
jgi:cell division protease FtsH